ncbi:peptide-methionine (S)-S-oxide reductase [Cellulophaga sp. F20128]|uniref:peptide-methionine (S)-S-oxide reductase n=1 Tax=Cellulophaga sp. F20128 TaxID=2926413 RepID=UPI001FF5F508|nr:peptide-methionine (S)-S-oxide reductase [Cellulophaga sp. F20128]MCK0157781.1 peptide-methionine (S)-S-oxide reductase [Cellulophaga sp. F20128]
MKNVKKIGFGGGCHWCTEAVFQILKGVHTVEQGWIASEGDACAFSEAVIVTYDATEISLDILIAVHVHTHKSTASHSMRKKYRSAIYYFRGEDVVPINQALTSLQVTIHEQLIIQVLPFKSFQASQEALQNYYKKDPQKPFCEKYIDPKLIHILQKFSNFTKKEETKHLIETEQCKQN